VRALGGRGKQIEICLCQAQVWHKQLFELPQGLPKPPSPRITTKRGMGYASAEVQVSVSVKKWVGVRQKAVSSEAVQV
jgi:hypothetical protein